MEVKYDSSQDITLILEDEEVKALQRGPAEHFYKVHTSSEGKNQDGRYYILLKGLCRELGVFFFLGYSDDPDRSFENAMDMEGFGRISIPDTKEYPWLINLSQEGYEHFQRGWPNGIRYDGSSKLFIKRREK